MTGANAINLTLPVGRLIQGSTHKAYDKDTSGAPLLIKQGPNAGRPTVKFFSTVAIPKEPGHTHWAYTTWGARILALGRAAFPNGQAEQPTFAWKITDGDSTVLNAGNPPRRPCDLEGAPGHWLVKCTNGFAPKTYNSDGSAEIPPTSIKLGDYVEVNLTVDSNANLQKPGLYMNHGMIALTRAGVEIVTGVSVEQAGFGKAPLPPGAQLAPQTAAGQAFQPPPVGGIPPTSALPPAAGAAGLPPGAAYVPPPVTGAPPVSHSSPPPMPPPNPAILAVPQVRSPDQRLTAAANGASYATLIGSGWTDALLIQHGVMLAA